MKSFGHNRRESGALTFEYLLIVTLLVLAIFLLTPLLRTALEQMDERLETASEFNYPCPLVGSCP